jgi:hypothetical protein
MERDHEDVDLGRARRTASVSCMSACGAAVEWVTRHAHALPISPTPDLPACARNSAIVRPR